MDVLTKSQRSFNMSQIKGSNTKPEILLKKFLRDLKIPYKENYKYLVGTPDIYIPALNVVIQVHGCFWHGHKGCRYFVPPKSNESFWLDKINGNVKRDKKVDLELKKMNLKVCTIWECEIRNGKFLDKIFKYLKS
jgi:DNA mismatch endonuclease (patch repair protein)